MKIFSYLCLLMAAVTIGGHAASAMTMAPMQLELQAAGGRSHGQFVVTNGSNAPLPVEIEIQRLSYTESGDRVLGKSADELAVFPMTAMIQPGATQAFRIQWVGAPDIAKSQSFAVTARQLPIRMKEDGHARVQIVSAFSAILNVAPAQGAADLKLVSSSPAKTAQGKPALAIVVENPTNVHALIANSVLRVGSLTLNQETMRTTVGIGVVEPRKRRRFIVPLATSSGGPVSLEYRPRSI